MIGRAILAGSMVLALLGCSAEVAVSEGWARETAPGQSAAAVYATIVNEGGARDRLVTVEASRGEASLHSSSSAGGVARMRPLPDGLEIPARSTVELKPGGTHIMLIGLAQPLRRGQTIDLTLGFERSGRRRIAIRVVNAGADTHAGHAM